ncbi:hypothetical protein GGI43DRAFT_136405 [Trichoderma evansii]
MQPPSLSRGQLQVDKGLLLSLFTSPPLIPLYRRNPICDMPGFAAFVCPFFPYNSCLLAAAAFSSATLSRDNSHVQITILVLWQSISGEPSSICCSDEQKKASVWIPMIAAGYSVLFVGHRLRSKPWRPPAWLSMAP